MICQMPSTQRGVMVALLLIPISNGNLYPNQRHQQRPTNPEGLQELFQ
jgi:hypothetical protein